MEGFSAAMPRQALLTITVWDYPGESTGCHTATIWVPASRCRLIQQRRRNQPIRRNHCAKCLSEEWAGTDKTQAGPSGGIIVVHVLGCQACPLTLAAASL